MFGLEAARAHEAVAVADAAATKVDLVDHPVAVERMIAPQRLVKLIFGVPQIDAVDVGWDRAFDYVERERGYFFMLRCPRAIEIRVITGPQR